MALRRTRLAAMINITAGATQHAAKQERKTPLRAHRFLVVRHAGSKCGTGQPRRALWNDRSGNSRCRRCALRGWAHAADAARLKGKKQADLRHEAGLGGLSHERIPWPRPRTATRPSGSIDRASIADGDN